MGVIIEFVKGIVQLFWDFMGFILDVDFNEEEENPFSNIETDSEAKADNQVKETSPKTVNPEQVFKNKEAQHLEAAFGRNAADFIMEMRDEVDKVIKTHGLEYTDSILTVIPPEKLGKSDIKATVINGIIESIYSQFDGDVILRPGKVNVFITGEGQKYAEIYIDCYKPAEVLVNR